MKAAMTALLCVLLCCGAAAADPPRPNVLLIVADDLGSDVGAGPNLTGLAKQSMRFTGWLEVPRCRPSLASFLSGQYSDTNGIWANATGGAPLNPLGSLPNALKAAGYHCHLEGKYWEGDPGAMGFTSWGPLPNSYGNLSWGRGDQLNGQAFIQQANYEQAPWFFFCSYGLPHTPHDATTAYLNLPFFQNVPIPTWFDGDPVAYISRQRAYLANCYRLDKAAGQLIGELALQQQFPWSNPASQLDNTLVVFVSDNGYAIGAMSKNAPSELGLRTPLYFRHPSLPPGQIPAVVNAASIAPTILEFCGVPVPSQMTAPSLLPLMLGAEALPTAPVFSAAYDSGGPRKDRAFALVARTQDGWLYRKWLQNAGPSQPHEMNEPGLVTIPAVAAGTEQLYHAATDVVLATDRSAEQPELLAELRQLTQEWWDGPAPPPGSSNQIDDFDQAGFSLVGSWTAQNPSDRAGALNNNVHYASKGTGDRVATWTFGNLEPGIYQVSATWNPYSNRASDAPYRLYADADVDPTDTIRVSQKLAPASFVDQAGQPWKTLGNVPTSTGTIRVTLANDADNYVIADGVVVIKVGE